MDDSHASHGFAPPSTATRTAVLMLRVSALLSDELDEALRDASGIGLSEVMVMLQLLEGGGRAKMTELADNLVVTRGGVTKIVDRLVADGYVERVPSQEDRRVVFARVTDAGVEIIQQHQPLFEAITERRLAGLLSELELEGIHDMMHRLSCENPGWVPPESVLEAHAAEG
jgi:MarR family 2-MHQ and catechol resistance regulon transcriptional repressor